MLKTRLHSLRLDGGQFVSPLRQLGFICCRMLTDFILVQAKLAPEKSSWRAFYATWLSARDAGADQNSFTATTSWFLHFFLRKMLGASSCIFKFTFVPNGRCSMPIFSIPAMLVPSVRAEIKGYSPSYR